jgi:hypothetical protein
MHAYSRQPGGKNLLGISMPSVEGVTKVELKKLVVNWAELNLKSLIDSCEHNAKPPRAINSCNFLTR